MSPRFATPSRDVEPAAAEFLQVLADPTRRQIFLLLMGGEVCNCEVAAELGLAENLVSHHLRKLREVGLAEEHRDAHDARWIHWTVNVQRLEAVWRSLNAAFDPSRLGSRRPGCCRTYQPEAPTLRRSPRRWQVRDESGVDTAVASTRRLTPLAASQNAADHEEPIGRA